ncbi:MAG: NAD(P)/FAD-dependent oxidoreductase [Marinosulfonomonas sp.]
MNTDFLVIGGGIAGISTAARLSLLGNVTVLEAESGLGYHASGRSAAVFEEAYGVPTTLELNKASRDFHMSENGGVLSPLGMMLVGTDKDRDAFATDLKLMHLDPISVAEAREMVPILNPDCVTQVGHHADAWNIDTDLLIQNFARTVRANGGSVVPNARVTGISRQANGWLVSTKDAEHTASTLVNAAGAWVDEIATMAGVTPIGFTPCRRSMARIPAPGGHDVSGWPMMHGPNSAWYAKADAGSLLVSPSEEDPSTPHDAWPDDMVLAEGLDRYASVMTEPVTRLEASWAGLRTHAPDRNLVLGRDLREKDFVWVAGQSGVGFQTAPAASQLIADLVDGRTSELPPQTVAALSPARFG